MHNLLSYAELCIIAMTTQDDPIDLRGDFEFTMEGYVEWILQDRGEEPFLQIILDEPIAAETKHILLNPFL